MDDDENREPGGWQVEFDEVVIPPEEVARARAANPELDQALTAVERGLDQGWRGRPRRQPEAVGPACTGGCAGPVAEVVDLPCGCQDVRYVDGTVCHEHNHVVCEGQPKTAEGDDECE